MRTLVSGFLLCLVAACALPFAAGERQYRGVYSESFEHMTFKAAGREELWYTGGSAQTQFRAAAPAGSNLEAGFQVCAVIRGRLSPRGRYGHLGLFAHEIEITQVIEAQPCD